MEIKTCEQYVLEKLEKAETDVESLKNLLEIRESQFAIIAEELKEIKDLVRRRCTLGETDEGDKLIRFDSTWEEYDPIDYNMFADIIKENMEG